LCGLIPTTSSPFYPRIYQLSKPKQGHDPRYRSRHHRRHRSRHRSV
jgi:hypothetical protein